MGKYEYLLKNVGLMTISNFGSKILSFLLVPLYTSVLSTSEYGTYDLYVITIFLLTPILSLNIVEALMRFSLDEENDKSAVFMGALFHYSIACLTCVLLVRINSSFRIIKSFCEYPLFFVLYFALSLLSDLMIQFARGLEKLTDVAATGIINSGIMLSLNVLFLLVFKLGLSGYFLANCSAFFASSVYLFFKLKVWKYFDISKIFDLRKKMTQYSKPMILNTIGWWINNASDKYVVTWLCGTAINGIFSVAYKIPSILTMLQTIFNQAWTISAVKEFDDKSGEFYSNTYTVYNAILVLCCSMLIVFNKLVARLLFAKEFYMAWEFAPFLMIAVIFSSLSSLLGGIFAAAKKSNIYGKTTMVGAIVNIFANIVLVLLYGAIGAAIATVISNVIVWMARVAEANKIISLKINHKRNIISYGIIGIQAIYMLACKNELLLYCGEGICALSVILMYWRDLKPIILKIIGMERKLGMRK